MDSRPGTYALLLNAPAPATLQVGKLGVLSLQPGCYLYIGSAFGPGGVRARVGHHTRPSPRPHWHIDYVHSHTALTEVWYTYDTMRREHQWAQMLLSLPQISVPLAGFGASDCTCASHLLHMGTPLTFSTFQKKIWMLATNHAPVRRHRFSVNHISSNR